MIVNNMITDYDKIGTRMPYKLGGLINMMNTKRIREAMAMAIRTLGVDPIHFTSGDRITFEDGKVVLYEQESGLRLRWGKVRFEKRAGIIDELCDKRKGFKDLFEATIPKIELNFNWENTKNNRIRIAQIVRGNIGSFINIRIKDGKIVVKQDGITKKWGKMTMENKVIAIQSEIGNNPSLEDLFIV
jgi:hypothetical protein